MKTKIFLNVAHEPDRKDSVCLNTGHGYYAYVSTGDVFLHQLFKELSLWSGPTDILYHCDGETVYKQYELSCQDKAFFKSRTFQHLCKHHNAELTIYDTSDNPKILRGFWDSVKHNY